MVDDKKKRREERKKMLIENIKKLQRELLEQHGDYSPEEIDFLLNDKKEVKEEDACGSKENQL